MLIKMIKITLSLILALCLGASLASTPARAAGGQKQQCQRAIKDCIDKAKRMTCNRPWQFADYQDRLDYYKRNIIQQNKPLCGRGKWWSCPAGDLARGCPSNKQVMVPGKVEAAIQKTRRELVRQCVKHHVL